MDNDFNFKDEKSLIKKWSQLFNLNKFVKNTKISLLQFYFFNYKV